METNEELIRRSTGPRPRRPLTSRILRTFCLIWLDANIDEENDDYFCSSIRMLREVVNVVHLFKNVDQCMKFINSMRDEKIFIILPHYLGQVRVPDIHDQPQINTIYIFCRDKRQLLKWAEDWPKIKGVFTDITAICEALTEQATHDCNYNSVSISFIPKIDETSVPSFDTLEPSFMYTQILKEILLTINFEQSHIDDFLTYYRTEFVEERNAIQMIEKLRNEYSSHQPIWWYTYSPLLYSELNKALRIAQIDVIIKIGFFARDLHNDITQLHAQQNSGQNHFSSFFLYRGQGLSLTDFDRLKNSQGGLLSFNNFLSTSRCQAVSNLFAESNAENPNSVGILFIMEIDLSVSTTPFANIATLSQYEEEEEILFSMHSIFRIDQVKQMNENGRLWHVNLRLTSDNDPQLLAVTRNIQEEIADSTGWQRLGKLLLKLSQFDKAGQIYETLLKQTNCEDGKANIFHHLGVAEDGLDNYAKAVEHYKEAIEIRQKRSTPHHSDLLITYNNLANVYYKMGDYQAAMLIFVRVLEMRQKVLPEIDIQLAISYKSMGNVYDKMGDYSNALGSYEKALEISRQVLAENHPHLAIYYQSVGKTQAKIGEYSKAVSSHQKALTIQQRTLLQNDPDLAASYSEIGIVCDRMGAYAKAISYYESARRIFEKALPENHLSLATCHNNIGEAYRNMGKYSEALSSYHKALEIEQKTFPENHPNLTTLYNNIAETYSHLGEYSKALLYHEKVLEIRSKALPQDPYDLVISYNNIGLLHSNMGEYWKALSFHDKALTVLETFFPTTHPLLGTNYNNIGYAYDKLGEHEKAFLFYEKALKQRQAALPTNHPHLATCYNNMGHVCNKMGEYSKALLYHEKALEIKHKAVPLDSHELAVSYNNIALVYSNMGEYWKALSFHEKAREIFETMGSRNHSSLATSYKNTGDVYLNMREYSEALSYYKRALDIRQLLLPPHHSDIKDVQEKIENMKQKL